MYTKDAEKMRVMSYNVDIPVLHGTDFTTAEMIARTGFVALSLSLALMRAILAKASTLPPPYPTHCLTQV